MLFNYSLQAIDPSPKKHENILEKKGKSQYNPFCNFIFTLWFWFFFSYFLFFSSYFFFFLFAKKHRKSGLEPWDTKPSKIQTIFQLSVTALAFLAFAGYLLCMIVQAIKSKGMVWNFLFDFLFCIFPSQQKKTGTTYMYPTNGGYPTTSITTSAIKKRKPFGRRRRDIFLSADNRNDTIDSIYYDSLATPDPDQMFQVMVNFAEGYVRFNHLY